MSGLDPIQTGAASCEFCREIPPAPWLYCQKDECRRASLANLVRTVTESRARAQDASNDVLVLRSTQKQSKQANCPLCKVSIETSPRSTCGNCQTTYHNDCLLELTSSRCSTIGCNKLVVAVG